MRDQCRSTATPRKFNLRGMKENVQSRRWHAFLYSIQAACFDITFSAPFAVRSTVQRVPFGCRGLVHDGALRWSRITLVEYARSAQLPSVHDSLFYWVLLPVYRLCGVFISRRSCDSRGTPVHVRPKSEGVALDPAKAICHCMRVPCGSLSRLVYGFSLL